MRLCLEVIVGAELRLLFTARVVDDGCFLLIVFFSVYFVWLDALFRFDDSPGVYFLDEEKEEEEEEEKEEVEEGGLFSWLDNKSPKITAVCRCDALFFDEIVDLSCIDEEDVPEL